jgi:hypothetical protein
MADLVDHVAWFVTRWSDRLQGNRSQESPSPRPPDGDDAVRVAWLRGLGDELLAELHGTSADTPVRTWFEPDQTAGFVARRCANELAVHRYDAQSARGTCAPIAAELAVDGIEELLFVLSTRIYRAGEGGGETIHLHGTDDLDPDLGSKAEWLLTLGPDDLEVRREHAKGDLALRAGVSDLELLLFGRPPLGPVQRFGDEAVLDTWSRAFTF